MGCENTFHKMVAVLLQPFAVVIPDHPFYVSYIAELSNFQVTQEQHCALCIYLWAASQK
jgi:hypothetical protein